MSILKKLNTGGNDVEEAKDSLGGGFSLKESDIYTGDIVVAYLTESKGGATAVNLDIKLEDGSSYRETVYVSNRNGDTFYVKDGKKYPLPGFTLIDDICLIATDAGLAEQENVEEKTLMLWDFESRKEIPREVPVLVDLAGQTISLGILKNRENKTVDDGTGKYVATNEPREFNSINAVFHPELKVTVREASEGRDAAFWDAWVKRNKDRLNDKFKEVAQRGGRASTSTASSSGAPARKSMFNKKG